MNSTIGLTHCAEKVEYENQLAFEMAIHQQTLCIIIKQNTKKRREKNE